MQTHFFPFQQLSACASAQITAHLPLTPFQQLPCYCHPVSEFANTQFFHPEAPLPETHFLQAALFFFHSRTGSLQAPAPFQAQIFPAPLSVIHTAGQASSALRMRLLKASAFPEAFCQGLLSQDSP